MPGYYETYLHGLNQAVPMARLAESERMNTFRQQFQAQQLQRQYQQMMLQEALRQHNQQRLEQSFRETERHNRATEGRGDDAIKLMMLRLQQQVQQGSFELKEDSEGNQWAYDKRTNKMMPVGVGGQPSGQPPIAGGTAPAPTRFNAPKALPVKERSDLSQISGDYQALISLAKSFKPNYAGAPLPVLGELQNIAGQYGPEALGLSDQANWWREYEKLSQLPARHAAFGGAVTRTEMPLWAKGEVNPGMRPEDVTKMLNVRAALMNRGLRRRLKSASSAYNRREVEAAGGMPAGDVPQDMPSLEGLASEGARYTGIGRPPLEQILR